MSFNFATPSKNATGFTLPTSTGAAAPTGAQFNFAPSAGGGGDIANTQTKPLGLFGTPLTGTTAPAATAAPAFGLGATTATTTPATGLFGAQPVTTGPQFSLGSALAATSAPSAISSSFGFKTATTPAASIGFSLGTSTLSLGAVPAATSAAPLSFVGLGASAPTTSALSFSLGGLATSTAAAATSALPAAGTLTFSQLEDAINKWTVDLEEQGKVFANQAKHLNAWDRLLMSNGEKILSVSNGVERIKQQQQQLDQELDFVLAQQKELEDCIVPLEKEYEDVPVSDVDRDQTYKLAENIDAQLKQMSEDLKEIIEHLNESNKSQELSDPVAQIGRILNAHMSSLQWIDRSTSQISSHLDEIAKMHDVNRRNNENIHSVGS